jgi:hemoglobin
VTEQSVYEALGGMTFFTSLVDGFYARVAVDPVLLPLYPEPTDLGPARERLTLFLAQYWGGPTTYSDERGHPRLRMRHVPYVIGVVERDAWLVAMTASMDDLQPAPEFRQRLDAYFAMAADSLRNRPEETEPQAPVGPAAVALTAKRTTT